MKLGDCVLSLGDRWISPGCEGKIISFPENANSAYVIWYKIVGKGNIGMSLYHSIKDLEVCKKGHINPNIEFLRRQK
jgi:hypothetical protein